MPTSFSQAFGLSGSRVSILTATTSNLSPPSFACSASSAGISLRHGTHQVAHRFSSTVRPRQSASVRGLPSASLNARSGSRRGVGRDADAGDLAARQRGEPLGQLGRRAARRIRRIALQRADPVYRRKPDDDARNPAKRDHGKPAFGERFGAIGSVIGEHSAVGS